MKFPLLLLAPMLTFAFVKQPIPVPVDPHGAKPALTSGSVLDDGTWVVSDTSDRVWWSRNQGVRWDSIPRVDPNDWNEIFGRTVTTSNEKKWWSSAAGWADVAMPALCQKGTERSTSSAGWMGVFDGDAGRITYCRSTDNMKTWNVWFSMNSSFANPMDPVGSVAAGLAWYKFVDSGYIRGTSDGATWIRASIPSGLKSFSFVPSPAELFLFGSKTQDGELFAATSSDSGRSWDIRSMLEPGGWIFEASPHLFWSQAYNAKKEKSLWVSASRSGPWEFVSPSTGDHVFNDGDTPYVVGDSGIFRLVLENTGTAQRPLLEKIATIRLSKSVQIDFPIAFIGSAWTQVGLDGRVVASGVLARSRLELPLRPGATLLRVGASTWKLPPIGADKF